MNITDTEKDEIINEINSLQRRTKLLQKLINEEKQNFTKVLQPQIVVDQKSNTTFKSRSIC